MSIKEYYSHLKKDQHLEILVNLYTLEVLESPLAQERIQDRATRGWVSEKYESVVEPTECAYVLIDDIIIL